MRNVRDDKLMAEAVALGRLAKGRTAPNPAVGAVVARRGRVVGRGFHAAAGKPHAEVEALGQAGAAARGASLYVTLEPCGVRGRTPACVPAVIRAGVRRVIIGTLDPNPKVAGRGAAALAAAGVEVKLGVRERACRHLVEDFAKFVTTGRPWVTAKYAMSLDGKIATRTGDAAWISGDAARAYAHALREEHSAVVVGKGTAAADDPRLTVRREGFDPARGPIRVVVASDAALGGAARVYEGAPRPPTWVVCTSRAAKRARERLARRGVEVLVCEEDRRRVDLESFLEALGRRGVTSILVEGGGTLLGSFFDRDLVDRVVVVISPKIIGGGRGKTPVAGKGVARVAAAKTLRESRRRVFARDVVWEGYLRDINVYFGNVAQATAAWKRRGRGRPRGAS